MNNHNENDPRGYGGYIPPYTPPNPGHRPPNQGYGQFHPTHNPNQHNYQRLPGPPFYNSAPPPSPPDRSLRTDIRRNSNIIGAALVLVYLIMITSITVPEIIAEAVLSPNNFVEIYHIMDQVTMIAGYGLAFLVALILIKYSVEIPSQVAFPVRGGLFSIAFPAIFICLALNILGGFLAISIISLLEFIFGTASAAPDFTSPSVYQGPLALILHIVALTVLPSILEELVFRGVIMQSLRRFGDSFALVVSSILFGLVHGNLAQAIPAFFVGLALGYFVLRTGSIMTAIVIHFINNAIVVVVDILTRGNVELLILANSIIILTYIFTGILSLVYLLVRYPGIFQLAPSSAPISEGRKYLHFFTTPMAIIFLLLSAVLIVLHFAI